MTTVEGIDAKKDEEMYTKLKIDLSNFATGTYSVDLYCFATIGKGQVDNYDVVDSAVSFEVVNNSSATGGLDWSHDAWGHTVFSPIEIE